MKRYGLRIFAAVTLVLSLFWLYIASRNDDLASMYRSEASNAAASAMRPDRTESLEDIRRRTQSLGDSAYDYADKASFYRMLGFGGIVLVIGIAVFPFIRRQVSRIGAGGSLGGLATKRGWNIALIVVGAVGFVGSTYFLYDNWHRLIQTFNRNWFDFLFALCVGGLGFGLLTTGLIRLLGRMPTWLMRAAYGMVGWVVVAGVAAATAGVVWSSREKQAWQAVESHPEDRDAWGAYLQIPAAVRRPEAYPLFVEKSPEFHTPRESYTLMWVLQDLTYAHADHPLVQDAKRRLEEIVGPLDNPGTMKQPTYDAKGGYETKRDERPPEQYGPSP